MNRRAILAAVVSLTTGIALLALLMAIAGVQLQALSSRLAAMNRLAFLRVAVLLAANTYLSSQKWRLVDHAMRRIEDVGPSRFESFALTSLGTALGLFLPTPLSMPLARTLGIWLKGRALQRGALGTYFEQGFDLLFACFLAIAAATIFLLHGGMLMWAAVAAATSALAVLCAGALLRLVRWLTVRLRPEKASSSRWRKYATELSGSALLDPSLGRRLMLLSGLRFVALVLMAGQIAAAIRADVHLWHFAVVMPFAVFATAAGITPGGLGVTEFTYAGLLSALGTPLAISTQWALANRLLISAASIAIAILLLPFLVAIRTRDGATEESERPKRTGVAPKA